MKSGNLNFLEHSGPVQACNESALPFYIKLLIHCVQVREKYRQLTHVIWTVMFFFPLVFSIFLLHMMYKKKQV